MKISLCMITKNIEKNNPLIKFIDNAEKYGCRPSDIILVYSESFDANYVSAISARCPLLLTNIRDTQALKDMLKRRKISSNAINTLLDYEQPHKLWPYSYSRNIVLMLAAMNMSDAIIFIDSDVEPSVLSSKSNQLEEIDFISSHINLLRQGAQVTSSEYSGYNILPIAEFDGQEELLIGLQKENMSDWWVNSTKHKSLIYQPESKKAEECQKVLGGNLAIKIDALKYLSPFFSSCYYVGNNYYLTRGEDTILTKSIIDNNVKCMDTNTYIFHDTYGNFPKEPNLKDDLSVQERFFYACMGWIGRNPFYNWLLKTNNNEDLRFNMLKKGTKALIKYTKNESFKLLLDAYRAAKENLSIMIEKYNKTLEAWYEFLKGCEIA